MNTTNANQNHKHKLRTLQAAKTKTRPSHVARTMAAALLLSLQAAVLQQSHAQAQENGTLSGASLAAKNLPDLSATSDKPTTAIIGEDVFLTCIVKNLQNHTIMWKFSNEVNAPAASDEFGVGSESPSVEPASKASLGDVAAANAILLTAGHEVITSDDRVSVIGSHDTWLLKIEKARQADTGTYFCQANSVPPVRAVRILSVIPRTGDLDLLNKPEDELDEERLEEFDHNFSECCAVELVPSKCQPLCSFKTLSAHFQTLSIVNVCFSSLPIITKCMVAGRNVTSCCASRHVPGTCMQMCGHTSMQPTTGAEELAHKDNSMSVQDQYACADYSAVVMSCK